MIQYLQREAIMKKKNCKLASILRVIALPLVGSAGG